MTESTELPAAKKQLSPTEILQAQYDVLSNMYEELSNQNERMVQSLVELNDTLSIQKISVKIEDFNMPFMALVGLMVKIALASIPALLILAVLSGCLWATIASLGISFLSGF